MVLVDDLMEPFRPVVDWAVYNLHDPGPLDAGAKARLVALTQAQLSHERGMVSLAQGCHDLATSLALALLGERKILIYRPPAPSPLLGQMGNDDPLRGFSTYVERAMFDLPTQTKKQRRKAALFRNHLLDGGFLCCSILSIKNSSPPKMLPSARQLISNVACRKRAAGESCFSPQNNGG